MIHLKPYVHDIFPEKISLGRSFYKIRFYFSFLAEDFTKSYIGKTSETVHKDLNKTLRFFVVSEDNIHQGEKLRAMVVEYSSMRV